MKDYKGFTIMEMLIVLAIISALITISLPIFSGSLDRSKKVVCEANRSIFMRTFFALAVVDDEGHTLEDAVNGSYPDMVSSVDGLVCPAGGEITVAAEKLVCSIHGGMSGSDPESPGGGTETPDSPVLKLIKNSSGDWSGYCDDLEERIKNEKINGEVLKDGTVFSFGGKYYVSKHGQYVNQTKIDDYKNNPDGFPAALQKFNPNEYIDSSNHETSNEWTPLLKNGDFFYENGSAYVFLGADNTQYEANPLTGGGNWVKLLLK